MPEQPDKHLEAVATELYGLAPEEFVAARDAHAKQARAAGSRDLASQVGALPKPTAAAWLLNQLARRQPDVVAELVDLGERLRSAQRSLAGDQMRALTRQRQQVVGAFVRRVAALADEAGRPLSAAVRQQVDETLRAAVADTAAGEALLTGRLTSALTYVGMGEVDVSGAVAAPQPRGRAGTAPSAMRPTLAERPDDDVTADSRRRRAIAEAAARDAHERAAQAAADLDRAQARQRDLDDRAAQVQQRIAEAQAALERVRREVDELEDLRAQAGQQREEAARRSTEAAETAKAAEAEVDALPPETAG